MVTRRALILSFTLGPCFAPAAMAGEFWDDQEPSQWSEKNLQRLLSKSPWAKETSAETSGGMGGRGMGGPEMGGPPPGMDMGGPGGPGGPGGRGGAGGSVVVRWESAAPIREARKKRLTDTSPGAYLISVSGLWMLGGFGPGLDAAGVEAMKKTTFLQAAGKAPVAPVRISTSFDESGVLFYEFPGTGEPFTAEDKQILFQSKSDLFTVRAKFTPKDMRYRGKFAL
jgi:hypothetical protein